MNEKLPDSINSLLWDSNKRLLDQNTHKQVIIERVLNYGTLADWRWLVERYGTDNIRTTLVARGPSSRSAIRDEARQLASLILR
ncbi:MAG: DUF6922 domain-containing protein [Minisyncoccota bacterium]